MYFTCHLFAFQLFILCPGETFKVNEVFETAFIKSDENLKTKTLFKV